MHRIRTFDSATCKAGAFQECGYINKESFEINKDSGVFVSSFCKINAQDSNRIVMLILTGSDIVSLDMRKL